jgi:hypothetical protein
METLVQRNIKLILPIYIHMYFWECSCIWMVCDFIYVVCICVCLWLITVTVNGINNIQLSEMLLDNRLAENPFHRMSQNDQCMSRSVNNSFGKYQLENSMTT